jgi:nucleotidyltransferase/DNA polymerase involved in DNA repair
MGKPLLLSKFQLHMDLDSFFVSVECLEHSEFRGKPLIIVVASCSYEARRFGIHSAMPSKMARKLCPHAIWLQGDMEKYSKYSGLITNMINDKAPLVEKASIDEFYLDISGMDKFFGCLKWTSELRQYLPKNQAFLFHLDYQLIKQSPRSLQEKENLTDRSIFFLVWKNLS